MRYIVTIVVMIIGCLFIKACEKEMTKFDEGKNCKIVADFEVLRGGKGILSHTHDKIIVTWDDGQKLLVDCGLNLAACNNIHTGERICNTHWLL